MSDTASLPPNEGKQLVLEVDGVAYARHPVRTPLVRAGDDVVALVRDAVRPHLRGGDTVVVSEKIVAIAQGRAFPVDEIEVSRAARFCSRFVTRSPVGIGLGSPETMELAIREAGLWRIVAAGVLAFLPRLFGKRGWFYVLAGHNVAAIDGPTPYTIPPYNRYAKLPPKGPRRVAEAMARALGAPVAIIDANDFGQKVLGASAGVDRRWVERVFADNPLGQGAQQTPVAIVRRVG